MSERDPLLGRLSQANPVPDELVEGASRSAAADRLLARVTAERPRFGVRHFRHARRLSLVAASIVLVAVLAAALILRVGGSAPASAAELLRRTAGVAADQASSVERGRFTYSRTAADQLATYGEAAFGWSVLLPVQEETWIAADGSGRIRSVTGQARFFGPKDRARWEASGSPPFATGASDDVFPPGALLYEDVDELPTHADELLDALRSQVAEEELPSDVAIFVRVGELLASADASPELRAALYRVASNLPGIELLGDVTDPEGRAGVAVAMTYRDRGTSLRAEMIFDEEDSALLAQRTTLLERASWIDAEPATVVQSIAYLATGHTNSLGDTPIPPEG